MRKLPSLPSLRAFEAAARLQSFVRAADELHLTPSAISHQVRGVEDYLGRPCFSRHNRRVELTAEGVRLLAKVSAAFDMIELACNEFSTSTMDQTLSVHCTPSFASKWLGPRLALFMRGNPHITIRMTSSADPVDLMRENDVDISIAYGAVRPQRGVIVKALGAERIVPLVSPGLIHDGPLQKQDIFALPLIESKLNPVQWSDWFAQNGLTMPRLPQSSFDRGALAISAAVDGLGVALESVRFAERELANRDLIVLGENLFHPVERETHYICFRFADEGTPKIKTFHDWLCRESDEFFGRVEGIPVSPSPS